MNKIPTLLTLIGFAMMSACVDQNPAELRDAASDLPVIGTWTANMTPLGTTNVTGSLNAVASQGFHMDVTFSVNGPPRASYQWRLFKGDCTVNVIASSSVAVGLVVIATVQSYPDIVLDSTGKATVTRTIAGTLDPQTGYSVRVRPTQTSTAFNGAITSTTGTNPIACGSLQKTN